MHAIKPWQFFYEGIRSDNEIDVVFDFILIFIHYMTAKTNWRETMFAIDGNVYSKVRYRLIKLLSILLSWWNFGTINIFFQSLPAKVKESF